MPNLWPELQKAVHSEGQKMRAGGKRPTSVCLTCLDTLALVGLQVAPGVRAKGPGVPSEPSFGFFLLRTLSKDPSKDVLSKYMPLFTNPYSVNKIKFRRAQPLKVDRKAYYLWPCGESCLTGVPAAHIRNDWQVWTCLLRPYVLLWSKNQYKWSNSFPFKSWNPSLSMWIVCFLLWVSILLVEMGYSLETFQIRFQLRTQINSGDPRNLLTTLIYSQHIQ